MQNSRRRGAVLILIAIALPVLLTLAAFAINLSYRELTRIELRGTSDFASRAGARTLSLTGDTNLALQRIQEVGTRNIVNGGPLTIAASQVEFGNVSMVAGSSRMLFSSDPGLTPNAARVNGISEGPAHVSFGTFLGTYDPLVVSTSAQIDRDLAIVLDRSGSMALKRDDGTNTSWTAGKPAPVDCRWASLVRAVEICLAELGGTPMDEKVSLVSYASTGKIDMDLAFDYAGFLAKLQAYSSAFAGGSTNISSGIELGRQTLKDRGQHRAWAEPSIVVLTDGLHNAGTEAPVVAAARAAAQGITVHTITYGADADQAGMIAVAAAGNGKHWHAPSEAALINVFREIASNTPVLTIE
jgi:Flp pilus assembly protein TadG